MSADGAAAAGVSDATTATTTACFIVMDAVHPYPLPLPLPRTRTFYPTSTPTSTRTPDQVQDKLKLLDYERGLLRPRGLPPLPRGDPHPQPHPHPHLRPIT